MLNHQPQEVKINWLILCPIHFRKIYLISIQIKTHYSLERVQITLLYECHSLKKRLHYLGELGDNHVATGFLTFNHYYV